MIHVVAIITAKPGQRATVLEHFRANVPAVHAEAGCIEYGATVDVENMGTAAYGPEGAWGPAPVYGSAFNMALRNLALLFAAADASLAMYRLLRRGPASGAGTGDRAGAEAAPATAPP